ncbi:tetratricopeptide repeat protein [Vallitalea maricola]|uniref:Uncharacterized protein n=1 Tax=Vallitalea maricola TaxID=3074433 RepID=A0ACB5UDZ9_9FIRM|nr:hypothetical protein AN2V17_02030 [Vallitalea sp. AN17-2]
MNIKKGLLAGLMVTTISMTALTSVYAKGPVVNKGKSNIAICTSNATECTIDSNFDFNFKEFSKEFKENVSQEDYKKAENLFNKAIKLEDDASEYWDELYKLDLFDTSVLLGNVEPMPFEEFSKMFKKDITTETKNKAKEIYNKIIKLEKEGKFDETMELWKELDSLELYDETNNIVMGTSTMENMSFEEFAKSFKKDLKEEDKKKAKKLFEKAVQLDKDKKYDEAVKVWDQLFEMNLFDEMGEIKNIEIGEDAAKVITFDDEVGFDKIGTESFSIAEMPGDVIIEINNTSFEEFSKNFKKDVKEEDKKKAKELYEKAVQLDKDKKYDEAVKVWIQLFEMNLFDETGAIKHIEIGEAVADVITFEGDVNLDKINGTGAMGINGHIITDKAGNAEIVNMDEDIFLDSAVIVGGMQELTFEEFSKGFKKDLKPEVIEKAKELFEKATAKEKEARKVWDEIYKMDIFEVSTKELSTMESSTEKEI